MKLNMLSAPINPLINLEHKAGLPALNLSFLIASEVSPKKRSIPSKSILQNIELPCPRKDKRLRS